MNRNLTNEKKDQKEIGRIELLDNQDLVASLIDDEKLDLRIFVKGDEIFVTLLPSAAKTGYLGKLEKDKPFCQGNSTGHWTAC